MPIPPPVGTPFLTPNGRVTDPWLAYFNAIGGIISGGGNVNIASSKFLKFDSSAADGNDGRLGNSLFAPGLNLVGINNDATARKIQIWGGVTQNENVLGNTWVGKNTFANPDNLNFGSNYQNWAPAVTASGSMSVSGVAIQEARYLRLGPCVHFTLTVWCNLGGAASNTLFLTLPVAPLNTATSLSMMAGGLYLPGVVANEVAFIYTNAGVLTVTRNGAPNFPLVSGVQIYSSGVYRVA